jgi:hypothetical protein
MHDGGVLMLVDSDRDTLVRFEEIFGSRNTATVGSRNTASVDLCTDFITARRLLLDNPPKLLVTNLRLAAYNGLHLVHLVATLGLWTQCVVYSDHHDALLIREVRSTGAMYEATHRIPFILTSYANAELSAGGSSDPLGIERLQRAARSAGSRG